MKYNTIEQLARVAEVAVVEERRALSNNERLQRWADVLGSDPGRTFKTLRETEYRRHEERDAMRSDDSPISAAFADPILRAEGMRDDTYGEARRFFGLSERALHRIVCYCHHGAEISAQSAARVVRGFTGSPQGVLGVLRRFFAA
jgi:hypothetical protein